MLKLIFGVGAFIIFILVLAFFVPSVSFEDHHCSVCEWNYVYGELLDYDDPDFGHAGALGDIWSNANYGKKVNLDWYENYRLKYSLDSVPSFYLINYSNVCPREPSLKYLGTGYIVGFSDWNYADQPYSKTTICINGSNESFDNCAWNPYPYDKSCLTHVFREKWGAWWNNFKEASLFDARAYVDKPEINNQSWVEYSIDYYEYLDNGGVDVGSEYRNRDWDLNLVYEYPSVG